ncbi:hypothetical protein LINPERPRIM_LOCUS35123, partial [Linum perenne]
EAQLWLRAMKESAQEVTWEQMKEWLYVRYSSIKIDERNKSSEVPDGGNFILELPFQELVRHSRLSLAPIPPLPLSPIAGFASVEDPDSSLSLGNHNRKISECKSDLAKSAMEDESVLLPFHFLDQTRHPIAKSAAGVVKRSD